MRTRAIDLRIVAACAAGVLALSATAAMGAAGAPPPNAPAACAWDARAAQLQLTNHDGVILSAQVRVKTAGGERAPSEGEVTLTPVVTGGEKVEQRVEWRSDARTLSGRSHVIQSDPYEIVIYLPPPFTFAWAKIDGAVVNGFVRGPLLRVTYTPRATKTVAWDLQCK